MKKLILLRHAKSSHQDESLDDFDRPLNQRGRHDAPRVGSLIAEEDLLPNLIISSTARRTRETTELVVAAASYRGAVVYRQELYLAPSEAYRGQLQSLAAEPEPACVLMVGHNPGIEDFLAELTGRDESMPTAAMGVIELPIDAWPALKRQNPGPPDPAMASARH